MDPALQELITTGAQNQPIEAIIKLRDVAHPPAEIEVVSRFGDVVTCRLAHEDIYATWADELTVSMKAPRLVGIDPIPENPPITPYFDEQITDYQRRPETPYAGRGVVMGIIDWGFDFTHPNFLDATGDTRFLALWDQAAKAHESTAKYGYGRAYSRDEINEALQTEAPFSHLGYHAATGDPTKTGAHGMHVCDIAAGNGNAGQKGVAPEVEIVAVHLAAGKLGGLSSLGDSVRILEAIDFISEVAGERPLVINMSVGKHGGPHNGMTLVEQGMDNFLTEKSGRAIVQSTGNYYSSRTHASGKISNTKPRQLSWHIYGTDKTNNELEVYYSGKAEMSVVLAPPFSDDFIHINLDEKKDIIIDNQQVGRVYHRKSEPNTGFNHVDIFLYQNAAPGHWEVFLYGKNTPKDEDWFHAWIERDGACRGCQSRFDKTDANPDTTTGTICNGQHTIAVGAYNPYSPEREVAPFSSAGPTLDGRQKPLLLAPGVHIEAARSARLEEQRSTGLTTIKSGTSMAAPHVAGAVALLFEAARRPLHISETVQIITQSVQSVSIPAIIENNRLGAGYLNIEKMIETITKNDAIEQAEHAHETCNCNKKEMDEQGMNDEILFENEEESEVDVLFENNEFDNFHLNEVHPIEAPY